MKKEIAKHSDKNFVKAVSMYMNAGRVIDSKSWQEFFDWMEKLDDKTAVDLSFKEYKVFKLTMHIEELLISIVDQFYQKDKASIESIKSVIVSSLSRYRNLNQIEALKILKKETENKDSNLINAQIIIYISGMGLGDIINIFDQNTNRFKDKKELVKKLRIFNGYRNDVTHNSLSSRIDYPKLLGEATNLGTTLYKELCIIFETEFNPRVIIKKKIFVR